MSDVINSQGWGLLEYKLQWTLSFKGWLIFLFLGLIFWGLFITKIQRFLALSRPIKADILLVEGWMLDSALEGAFQEYQKGNYKHLITTGSKIERYRRFIPYQSDAEMAADYLKQLGINPDDIIAISTPIVDLNRTATAALAVKDYLKNSALSLQSINLYSYDIHTRRSWLIYQKILHPDIKLGAIAHPSPHYNPQRWWTSSYGFKGMINEVIAYLYTRLLWFYLR